MSSKMDDLMAEVQLLRDERDILDTLHRYTHAFDYGRGDDLADCFTSNGVFEARGNIPGAPPTPFRLVGREELRAHLDERMGVWRSQHKHIQTNARITVRGDAATVLSYYMGLHADEGARQLGTFGRYEDTLVRDADGRWRIQTKVFEAEDERSGNAPATSGS